MWQNELIDLQNKIDIYTDLIYDRREQIKTNLLFWICSSLVGGYGIVRHAAFWASTGLFISGVLLYYIIYDFLGVRRLVRERNLFIRTLAREEAELLHRREKEIFARIDEYLERKSRRKLLP